jgi:regulator of RNase E activity RraA
VAVVEAERVDEVLAAAREREEKERVKGEKLSGGALSYDLDGLRAKVEGAVS